MKIIFDQVTIEVENWNDNYGVVFRKIHTKCEDNNQVLNYLEIDCKRDNDNFVKYFTDYMKSIQEVVVKMQDNKLTINEIFISTNEYVLNAKKRLKSLSEEFYQAPQSETWTDLADFFEGIQWILETVKKIDQIANIDAIITNYEVWNEYVQNISGLNTIVFDLNHAMQNHDHVLIGDLLQYEVLPIFENAELKLRLLMAPGGNHHAS